MNDHRNTILAVILSGIVLIGWQYFFVVPQMEKQQAAQKAQQQAQQTQTPGAPAPQAGAPPPRQARHSRTGTARSRSAAAGGTPGHARGRGRSLAAAEDRDAEDLRHHRAERRPHRRRVADAVSRHRRPEVAAGDPVLAVGSPNPDYAEFGWVGASGASAKLPDVNTDWKQEGATRSRSQRR